MAKKPGFLQTLQTIERELKAEGANLDSARMLRDLTEPEGTIRVLPMPPGAIYHVTHKDPHPRSNLCPFCEAGVPKEPIKGVR